MTPSEHDAFAFDDAAYVLGALPDDERAAFENHLVECDFCAARVAELAPVAQMLAVISEDDVVRANSPVAAKEVADAASVEPPAALLPSLLVRASRHRRRQRWTIAGLAGTAAAAIAALAIVVVTSTGGNSPARTAALQRPLTPVATNVALRATANLISEPWGTSIALDCHYTSTYLGGGNLTYSLTVVDGDGVRHDLGSWTLQPGTDAHFVSGVAVPMSEVRVVEIMQPNGTPVMRLTI